MPPDSHRFSERRVLAWMCAIIFVNQLGFGAVIPVLPLYASSFGVSVSAIGATVAVFGAARGLVVVLAFVLVAGLTALPRQDWWQNAALGPPLVAAALWRFRRRDVPA